jgi:HSP20 family protein
MKKNELARKEESAPEKAESRLVTDAVYLPAVDIHEGQEGLRLRADMPGVDPGSVNVTVENGVLTIEGRAVCEGPAGYDLVGQEFSVGRFRRDFSLSGDLNTEAIKAKVRNGVLELTLPKHASAKTRKIEVEA